MPDWPTVAAVKRSLGVTSSENDELITVALQASIEQVGWDLGYRDISVDEDSGDPDIYVLTGTLTDEEGPVEVEPTHSTSQAALILAVMAVKAPDAPFGIAAVFDTGGLRVAAQHPTYLRMLVGQREAFGVG